MRGIRITIPTLVAAALSLACLGVTPASALEVNNFVEPSFGAFQNINGIAVSPANGNVYVGEVDTGGTGSGAVKVFGGEGGAPAEGLPAIIEAAGSYGGNIAPEGVAVDSTGSDVYMSGYVPGIGGAVDEYRLSGSQYEYVCLLRFYGGGGNRCQADGGQPGPEEVNERTNTIIRGGGVALDPAGDLYVGEVSAPPEMGPNRGRLSSSTTPRAKLSASCRCRAPRKPVNRELNWVLLR